MSEQFTSIDQARLRDGFGVKWGSVGPDTLAAWIADMDFGIPPAVADALIEVVRSHDLGYPFWRDGRDPVVAAFEQRMAGKHGWTPRPNRTRVYTDLIQALQVMIEHTTEPGDGVAIHVPAYPPFLASIHRSGRRIVPLPMVDEGGGWTFATRGLTERLARHGCRLLVVVNPHNPTGRVFKRPELDALAAAADDLNLVVLSNETHSDLTYGEHTHVPFAGLGGSSAERTITTTSATKAFNIAGMRCAVAHVAPEHVWDALEREPLDYFGQPSILSRVATVAAWTRCSDWLDDLLRALSANRDRVSDWASALPFDLGYRSPEGTYLSWLDLSGTPVDGDDPAGDLEERARVKLSRGADFSQHTDVDTRRFVRLNFATSPHNLHEILRRLERSLRS